MYLEGVAGLLPAGTYALLPSRYALLPGAVLVEVAARGPGRGRRYDRPALTDGTPVAAGYATVAGTGPGGQPHHGFAIRPGSYGRQLAEYDDSLASSFFARRPPRPTPWLRSCRPTRASCRSRSATN